MSTTPSTFNPESVARYLAALLGKQVTCKRVPAPIGPIFPGKTPLVVGEYVDGDGVARAACVCDLNMTCFSAAALALMPPSVAQDAVRSGRVPETLGDNFSEVLNVLTRLFNDPLLPHVSFKNMHSPPQSPSAVVVKGINKPNVRLDLEIGIPGYGNGKLSMLTF